MEGGRKTYREKIRVTKAVVAINQKRETEKTQGISQRTREDLGKGGGKQLLRNKPQPEGGQKGVAPEGGGTSPALQAKRTQFPPTNVTGSQNENNKKNIKQGVWTGAV